jgi:hypothetical protein
LLLAVNIVQNRGVREETVDGEGAGNVFRTDPINQLLAQGRVVLEGDFQILTEVFLLKAAKVQRIVFAIGADVVHEEVVMGDQVALVGMIPEPNGTVMCNSFCILGL